MVKSGVIGAIVSLVLAIAFALLSPVCVPCVALFLGLGAGFLAGAFDKPIESKESVKVGAAAGAISGIGAALGQMIGAGLNSLLVGPEAVAKMLKQFGLETGGATGVGPGYWVGVFGGGLCFSLVDVVLMAIFGILGALVWSSLLGKREKSY
jgi:hypothetical protein